MAEKQKVRDSRFELLRIISMLMIVTCHIALVPSKLVPGFESSLVIQNNFINAQIAQILGMFGRIGNILFVMISGYFMINLTFKRKRLYSLFNKVHVYVWPTIPILLLIGVSRDIRGWLSLLFPIILEQYWFVTVFVALMIFAPFINILIHSLSQSNNLVLLLLLFIVTSLVSSVQLDG